MYHSPSGKLPKRRLENHKSKNLILTAWCLNYQHIIMTWPLKQFKMGIRLKFYSFKPDKSPFEVSLSSLSLISSPYTKQMFYSLPVE